MHLSERKKMILNAIVSEYIETAEPVSSVTVVNKYNAGCSSATVRNEMAELEEMGYLDKPHTSAGRIPSGRGYRFYVNTMLPYIMPNDIREELHRALTEDGTEMDDVLLRASELMTRFTDYTVFASDFFESGRKVYTGGVGNIFNHPEYNRDIDRARRLISFIDSRDSIFRIISDYDGTSRMQITIGDENTFDDLKDSSVVIAHFKNRRGHTGGLGIVGPTRMRYGRVIASLSAMTDMLETLMDEKER